VFFALLLFFYLKLGIVPFHMALPNCLLVSTCTCFSFLLATTSKLTNFLVLS